jgi:hypothetical protein
MSPEGLQAQCSPRGANNTLVTAVTGKGRHVEHCIVSQWIHKGYKVWWITQLVVHTQYRNQKTATRVGNSIRFCFAIN